MRHVNWFLIPMVLLLGVVAVLAQEDTCEIDQQDVMNIVDLVCSEVGENSVCYGNDDVNAVPRQEVPEFAFTVPGDEVDVVNIRSLYLSGLNTELDTWGIAKMSLLVNENARQQNINLLLFGDTSLDATEPDPELQIITDLPTNVRNVPTVDGTVIASVSNNTELTAVARLEDSSWVQVSLEDELIGWIFAPLINLVDETDNLADLPVRTSQSRYWGPMQAFYVRNGSSSACADQLVDGLLIQTPEGFARVSLFINEVTIDLIGGANGATAFVNTAGSGMNIAVLDGAANVEAQGTSYYVDTYQSTTIAINQDNQATSAPGTPIQYNIDTLIESPLLGLVRDLDLPFLPPTRATPTEEPPETGDGGDEGNENGGNNSGGNNGGGPPPCEQRGNSCDAPGQNK